MPNKAADDAGRGPAGCAQGVREQLSALADGEADASCRGACLEAWRRDEAARACWHRYQLVGDVLRSSELTSSATADAHFLAALRVRLEREPVPLAPAAWVQPHAQAEGVVQAVASDVASAGDAHLRVRDAARWQRRLAPAAVAAGFMAVAVLGVYWNGLGLGAGSPVLPSLAALQPGPGTSSMSGADAMVLPVSSAAEAEMIRSAKVEQYLQAHRRGAASWSTAQGAGPIVQVLHEGR